MSNYYKNQAKILFKMKRFQKEARKFRSKLDIPKDGFPRDERSKWYYEYGGKPDMSWKDIRKRLRLDANRQLLPKKREFVDALESFATGFNLDENWYMTLFSFLVGGENLRSPDLSVSIQVRLNDARLPENEWVVTHLSIDISKDSSIKDIEAIWPQIQKHQAKMKTNRSKRRKPFQDESVKKYIKVRELEDSGFSQQKIADQHLELGFSTASDVATYKRDIEKPFKPKHKK